MGGKSSKAEDKDKQSSSAGSQRQQAVSVDGSNPNAYMLVESPYKVQEGKNTATTTTSSLKQAPKKKAPTSQLASKPTTAQPELQKSYLETVITMIIQSERFVQLMEADEVVALPLSKAPKDAKNAALLRLVHSTVKSSFSKSELNALVKLFQEICKDNDGCFKIDLFMTVLMSNFRSVKIPAPGAQPLHLQTAISQLLARDAFEYENTGWEPSVRALLKDLSTIAGHPVHDHEDFTANYQTVQGALGSIPKEKFTAERFEATLQAVQKWVYEESEEIEESEEWKSLVSSFRGLAAKGLSGKYFDLKYSGPQSLILPNSLLYNSYYFSYNCNFGIVNFGESFLLARTINDFHINYYIEDERAVSKLIKFNCDIQMRGFKVSETRHRQYLPTFGSLVRTLNSFSTEVDVDIVNDFDLIAILNQEGRYRFAYKNDLINPLVKQGNITDIKLFFSKSESFSDRSSLKIILKSADLPMGEIYGSHLNLLLAKPDDTLQVLYNKLKSLNFDVENKELPADLLNHLLATLVVTTKSSLSKAEHKAAVEKARSKKYSFNTKLADLLEAVKQEQSGTDDVQSVDMIFYLDYTGYDYYQSKMSPPTVDQNYDGEEKIAFSFELSDIFNIALDVLGYNQDFAQKLTEAKVRELLPEHIFVNLESVNKFINVPREVEVDFLKTVISEQSLTITNQYKAISYVGKSSQGYYQIKVVPNEKDLAVAEFNGKEYRKCIRDLNMQNIVGVLLERREPNL